MRWRATGGSMSRPWRSSGRRPTMPTTLTIRDAGTVGGTTSAPGDVLLTRPVRSRRQRARPPPTDHAEDVRRGWRRAAGRYAGIIAAGDGPRFSIRARAFVVSLG